MPDRRARPVSIAPSVPAGAYVRRPAAGDPPFPFDQQHLRICPSASAALVHAARALELRAGDELLVPAIQDPATLDALTRAGFVCRLYDEDDELAPDAEALDALLGSRARGVVLTHHLGFAQDAARWRRWADERGLLLVEDATEAWLSTRDGNRAGDVGDAAVFGFEDWLGVPGAACLTAHGQADGEPAPALAAAVAAARLHARRGDGAHPSLLRFLAPRLWDPLVASRRRANYRALLGELGDAVPAGFRRLRTGDVPLALPVTTDGDGALARRLSAAGVQARASPLPRTLLLPVHQQLRPDAVERIAGAFGRPRTELTLEPIADFDAARADWTALAERTQNVFLTWEWASTWWRHLGEGRELLLTGARRPDGRLAAILPLFVAAERPVRTLRLVGHGLADRLGLVCDPRDRLDVTRALRTALGRGRWDWETLFASELPVEEGWGTLLGGRRWGHVSSPVLQVDGRDWDGYLASRSSHLRKRIRYQERKLAREHDVRFRLADDPDRLGRDLDELVALHTGRWQEETQAFAGSWGAFHRDFVPLALERGWLRLWLLELDGAPAAAYYGLRFGGVECYYQTGRDPRFDKLAPGAVVLVHAIRDAIESGVREYRFLRGAHDYKERYADGDSPVEGIALTRGVRGGAALAGAAATRALLPWERRQRLARLAG